MQLSSNECLIICVVICVFMCFVNIFSERQSLHCPAVSPWRVTGQRFLSRLAWWTRSFTGKVRKRTNSLSYFQSPFPFTPGLHDISRSCDMCWMLSWQYDMQKLIQKHSIIRCWCLFALGLLLMETPRRVSWVCRRYFHCSKIDLLRETLLATADILTMKQLSCTAV